MSFGVLAACSSMVSAVTAGAWCLPPAAAAPEHLAVEIIRSRAERRAALYRRRRDDGHIEHQGKILIRRVERDRQGAVVTRRDGQHMRQPAGIERALLRRAQRGGGVLRRQGRSVGKAYAGNKGIAIGLSVLRGREALTEQRLGTEMRRNDEQALIQQRKRRAVHRRRAGIGVEAVLRQVGQAERLRRGRRLRRGGRSLLRRLLRGLRGLTGRRAGAQQQSKQQARASSRFISALLPQPDDGRQRAAGHCPRAGATESLRWQAVQSALMSMHVTPARRSQIALSRFRST